MHKDCLMIDLAHCGIGMYLNSGLQRHMQIICVAMIQNSLNSKASQLSKSCVIQRSKSRRESLTVCFFLGGRDDDPVSYHLSVMIADVTSLL